MKTNELIISVLLVALTTGCSSIQTMEGPDLDRINVGEIVTIFEHSGTVTRVSIEDITVSDIIGTNTETSNSFSIEKSEIRAVEVERTDYGDAVATGVLGALSATIAAAMIGLVVLLAAY